MSDWQPMLWPEVLAGLQHCDACAGTGQTSPWDHDYMIWRDGVPVAVCGGCKGAGLLTRWGFALSQSRTAKIRAFFRENPASLTAYLRARPTPQQHNTSTGDAG